MFKKGDVVQGIKSLVIYECCEDSIGSRVFRLRCVDRSFVTDPRYTVAIGGTVYLVADELALYTYPVANWETLATAEGQEEEETDPDGLIAQRRALKNFLGGM